MREIRLHGQDRRYHHPRIGINGRLDTLQAAILLAKLEIFPEEVERRAEIGAEYTRLLQTVNGVIPPYVAPHNTSVYAQYTIQVEGRDRITERLKSHGIPTAVHYPVGLHMQPAFAHLAYNPDDFPITHSVAKRVMSLPIHPYLNATSEQAVVEALREHAYAHDTQGGLSEA